MTPAQYRDALAPYPSLRGTASWRRSPNVTLVGALWRPWDNWAERAAELGWNASLLFGFRRDRPLMHPGGAGLLWAINGGRLIELHREWAVFELAVNGSPRVFERRRVDVAKFTLPWTDRG
jgi:hypothetical protein